MGFIHNNHGRISIEERSESFIVHADYGYAPGMRALRDLPLGAEFVAPDETGAPRRWRVSVLAEDFVAGREQQASTIREWPPDTQVEVPGYEEAAPGPHARWWREAGHPEFSLDDLGDLIAALQIVATDGKQKT